jgi:alkyl hydroperoxide reductase subunit AhpC
VFTELGVNVVALSVDDKETSAALIAKHKPRFPVGHSADAGKVAAVTGAYVNEDPHYLQSTGFVLAPDETVRVAVYSSDAIGRLVADDVAGYIRYLTGHAA